eukprot:10134756-Alexandrium_andersonii.AAC.1
MVGRAVAAAGLGATDCGSCAGAGLAGKAFTGTTAADGDDLAGGAFCCGTMAARPPAVKPAGGFSS